MSNFYKFLIALTLTFFLTPLVRALSIKAGKVAAVKKDRWHSEPKALFGGVAIWLSWLLVCLPYASDKSMLMLLLGASAMFFLGLMDDLFGMNPQLKLIGQVVIVSSLIPFGLVVEIIPYPVIAIPLTIFWIVGITNSFNLLDNMDGLSAGIAFISSTAMGLLFTKNGNHAAAGCSFALAGACLGFLRYNFNPASIFMGDCGSLFLGFLLSTLTITGSWVHASGLFTTMAVPLFILAIPIFDTTFVTLNRKLQGKPISQGGRDHLSHRLVYLGVSEKNAVLILYGFSGFLGAACIYYDKLNPLLFVVIAVLFAIAFYCIGLVLGEGKDREEKQKAIVPVKKETVGILSKRRIAEILIDVTLISSAYYLSYLLRYEGNIESYDMELFVESLPWIIIIKLLTFTYMGLYKSIWKYVGIHDALDIIKAVLLSSSVMITTLLMSPSRFEGYSRAVFIIDAILTIVLVGGTRFIMLIFRDFLYNLRARGKRILLIGAGDAGAMVLKEIKNNQALDYHVVGFIDDDMKKLKTHIHGVPVIGNTETLARNAVENGVGEVIISIPSADRATISRITSICRESNLKYGTFPIVKKLMDRIHRKENRVKVC